MRIIISYTIALLFCLALSASVRASIMAPGFAEEFDAEELLWSIEEAELATTQTSSRQASSSSSCPTPLPSPVKENANPKLMAYLLTTTAGNSGGMSGSGTSAPNCGGISADVLAAEDVSLDDNTLVVWLNRSDWLAIPMPPSGSIERPPQCWVMHFG